MSKKKDEIKQPVTEPVKDPSSNTHENAEPSTKVEAEVIDFDAVYSEKEKQCLELQDRLLRTMAEYDNFRKRTLKEKASMYDDGVRDTLERLLPVADNLERALGTAADQEDTLYKGLEMTYRQFVEILQSLGVEALPSVGSVFDPNIHNAVSHIDKEDAGENEIVAEFQKGYKYRDKVLRPAMVQVAN
ncbi:MAG: nucleotide exchange factor GrpE [Clostridiales bacterium]|jgi:molecular chaperone GrpE|nr:nucleotide exchange factor GrpE [Clostridiales bacterium]